MRTLVLGFKGRVKPVNGMYIEHIVEEQSYTDAMHKTRLADVCVVLNTVNKTCYNKTRYSGHGASYMPIRFTDDKNCSAIDLSSSNYEGWLAFIEWLIENNIDLMNIPGEERFTFNLLLPTI